MLKEFDDLDISGMISDSKKTFEKHLCCFPNSFSRTWHLESWRVSHHRLLFGRYFRGFISFILPVLEYVLQYGNQLTHS